MRPITKEYIRRSGMLILIALFAWMYYYSPWKNYSYILIFLAVLYYMFGPKTKIPDGAAYYSKILLLDIMGFIYWTGMMIFFFYMMNTSCNSLGGAVFFFILFSIYPLYILWLSVEFSSKWYLFDDDTFKWSDADGVQSIALRDIISVAPYVKKKYLFSAAEMGIKIVTESGKKIKIISNNLEGNEMFMKRLQDLYLTYDDTFTEYFKSGTHPEEDEIFNKNLQELQKRMVENGRKKI